ncbi:MAG TPA: HEAT repeat domain-containing protein, partial [bacterium]|nr:HEAT repeat domain-containing protein [bacterium]
DIPNIRAANQAIDGIIEKLKAAESAGDIRRVNQEIYAMSKAGGLLYKGFSAAATDWSAEISSLGATTLEVIALSLVSAGAGGAARISMRALQSARKWVQALRAARQPVQALEKSAEVVSGALQAQKTLRPGRALFEAFRHSEALRAAGLGAYISSAENMASNLSGQLQVQPDTVLSWLKDAFATGLSMAVVAPLPPHAAATRKNALQGLWARYFANPAAGALRFTADTGKEVLEEVLDAYVRQVLDGRYQALSLEEFTDIVSVCAFGGAKMGLIKQVIGRGTRGIASIAQTRVTAEEKQNQARLLRGFRERGERVVLDPSRREFFLVDAEGALIRKVKRPAARTFLEFERSRLGEKAEGLPLVLFETVKRGSKGLLVAHSPESSPTTGSKGENQTVRETAASREVSSESEVEQSEVRPAVAEADSKSQTTERVEAEAETGSPEEAKDLPRLEGPWSTAEVANDNAQIPQAWKAAVNGEAFPLRPGVSPGLASSVAMASGVAGVVGVANAQTQARSHRVKAGEALKVPPTQVAQTMEAEARGSTAAVAPRGRKGVSRISAAKRSPAAAKSRGSQGGATLSLAPSPAAAQAAGPASGMVLGFMAVPAVEDSKRRAPMEALSEERPRSNEESKKKNKRKGSDQDQGRGGGKKRDTSETGVTRLTKSTQPVAVAAMAAGAALMLQPALAEASTGSSRQSALPDFLQVARELLPDWAQSFFGSGPGMVVLAVLTLGTFFVLRRLVGSFRSESSRLVEEGEPAAQPPNTAQEQVAQALTEALSQTAEAEVDSRSDIERLASVIVEVHDKVSPYFAEQGSAITLRDMLRSVDMLSALSLQKNLMSVFEILHLVLGMQFTEIAQREEVFRMIEEVRLSQGAMVEGIEQSFRHEAGAESVPSHPVLRAKIQALLRQEGIHGVVAIYSALAAQEDLNLKAWAGRSLRDAGPEAFEEFLTQLDREEFDSVSEWSDNEVAVWIDAHQIKSGVPWLLEALARGPGILRSHAASALGNLGVKSPEVEAALVAALQDSYSPVRPHAAGALQKLGYSHPGIGELEARERERFEHADVIQASLAIQNLGALQEISEDSQRVVLRALHIENARVVDSALDIIRGKSLKGQAVESALVALFLSKQQSDVGLRCLECLLDLGCRNEELEANLSAWLSSDDPELRIVAAAALTRMGRAPESAESILRDGLKIQDPKFAIWAAVGLDRLGVQDPEIGSVLRRGIVENPDAMIEGAFQLGVNRSFLAEIFAFGISHPNISAQLATMKRLLNRAEPLVELSFLLQRLQHQDTRVQRLARQILDRQYPGWDSAIPPFGAVQQVLSEVLFRSVSDSEHEQKEGLQKLLDQLSKWRNPSSPDLEKEAIQGRIRGLLAQENFSSIRDIYEGLAKVDGMALDVWLAEHFAQADAKTVETVLGQVGWSPLEELEWIANYRVEGGAQRAVAIYNDPDLSLRVRAVNALGLLRAPHPSAEALLFGALRDSDFYLSLNAAAALVKRGSHNDEVEEVLFNLLLGKWANVNAGEFIQEHLAALCRVRPQTQKRLLELLNQEGRQYTAILILSEAEVKDEAVEKALISMIQGEADILAELAIEALGRLGSANETTESVLRQQSLDFDRQSMSLRALAALGFQDQEIEQNLLRTLQGKERESFYRRKVAEAIELAGKAPLILLEALENSIPFSGTRDRAKMLRALQKLGRGKVDRVLLDLLGNDDEQSRRPAHELVVEFGLRNPEIFETLRGLLENPDKDVRKDAFATLQKIFPGWDSEVPARGRIQDVLSEELRRSVSESEENQNEGLRKLLDQLPKWSGTDFRREEIRRRLAKESTSDWASIYREIAEMQGTEWNLWQVAYLRNADPAEADRFLDHLGMGRIDEGKWLAQHRLQSGLPRLLAYLRDPDAKVRQNILHSLRDLDTKDAGVTAQIVKMLQDSSPEVQLEAVDLLQRNGSEPGSLAAVLAPLTAHQSAEIRLRAISLLTREAADEAVEQALIFATKDDHSRVRAKAAECIYKLGIASHPAIAGLREMLDERDHDCLLNAAVALLHLGQNDSEIDATLASLLPHEALNARYLNLVEKLKKLEPLPLPLFEATLVQRLRDPHHISDDRVADLLFHWGMKEELRRFAQDHRNHPNPRFRIRAIEILARLGEATTSDLDSLLEFFNSSDGQIQAIADRALHLVGAESEYVQKALQAMAESGDFEAMLLLAQVDPKHPYAAQGLVKSLGSDIEHVRSKAIETLVELQIGGPAIQAALLECLKDPDPFNRWEAAWALGKLEMRGPEVEAAVLPMIQEVAADLTVSIEAVQLLDGLQPGWDQRVAAEGRDLLKLVDEELQTEVSEVGQEASANLGGGLAHLPTWSGRDSSGKPFDAKKLEELRAFIPGPEKLTMIGPTIEALRGLMAGIISNTPVYLMAVTGVGKNAMLRYLANLT